MGPHQESPSSALEIMMISRGHGRGHAVPDIAIARELSARLPGLRIHHVSYAAGAEAFRGFGLPVTDLGVPDNHPFLDMIILFTRLFARTRPRFVVSHEEFPAVPAAEAFGIPCVILTDFFIEPLSMQMQMMKYAREIIFIAERGMFTEPPHFRGKVQYVGRAVRPFEYRPPDRQRAREELGLPLDATVALFQPGAWSEARLPISDLVLAAWELLPASPKRLIWLAGGDYQSLRPRLRDNPDVILLREDWKIDRLMVASDVLLTKANRTTVYEAASLGLPSISISTLVNWPDDVAVAHVESNTPLDPETLTPQRLMEQIVQSAARRPAPETKLSGGVVGAAERVVHHIREHLLAGPTA